MRSDNDGDEVTNSVMGLDLSMLRDDGTEVHSNGVELRDNMATGMSCRR